MGRYIYKFHTMDNSNRNKKKIFIQLKRVIKEMSF